MQPKPNTFTFVGVLNACARVLALEEGRCAHDQIIEGGWDSDIFVGSSLVEKYANVGAWRMLIECSTRCYLELSSLGMPYLQDVPCMGMAGQLLNILMGCVKKVYSQMMSFV